MSKDAYYFSHDSNAKDDPKCVLMIEQLGLEGYGIFWVLIETLREQPSYKYPMSLIPALARRFNTTAEKVKTVISGYELFEVDDKQFFSLSLIERMKKLEAKREQSKSAINSRWNKTKAINPPSENLYGRNTDVLPEYYGTNTSKVKESKVKESKVEESKVEVVNKIELQNSAAATATAKGCFTCYNENIGLMSPHIAEKMLSLLDDGIEENLIKRYIEVACERNIRNWAYVEKMAIGNAQNNIKTLEQYEASCVERETWGSRSQQRPEWEDWK
jgi:DnaD/phage-associated family protein